MQIAAGTRFGPYQFLSPLGAGGMGEVYLAEDTRLRRKVALKLLPEAFTRNVARLRRFEQEARAASALNHPNILTIHEIGTIDHTHFIATEFIDGQTLRERLKAGALAIPAALDLAIQIAAALAAAHDAGIVHRDIKPENVMVRRDGIVKVLDFGLAKLSEEAPAVVESEAPTIPKVNTDPGTVLGTASYMSPEQARGLDVDARSDIFSLGLVLYEMVAGRAPFTGANALEVISEILKTEPAPLRSYTPDVPAELQRIVTKALRKDREERYQLIRETLLDLKSLKQELEFEAKLKGAHAFVVPPSGGGVGAREMPPEGGTTNAIPTEAAINETAAARTTSSAEVILGEIKRHKTGVLMGMAVLLACVGLLAYSIYRFAAPRRPATHFQNVKFTQLTSTGNVKPGSISVSPDGKFIAYAQTDVGQHSLWTKAIATGSAIQIVPPAGNDLADTAFSPDGNYVYYRKQEGAYSLYQIPVLGGTPRRLLTGVESRITFAPDGQQFAFVRRSADGAQSQLILVKTADSEERVLATRRFEDKFDVPSWSPDGKLIVANAFDRKGSNIKSFLVSIDVASGETQPFFNPRWDLVSANDVEWLKDGKGVVVAAGEKGGTGFQLWQVAYPGDEIQRITNDLANYPSVSLTADNQALITNKVEVATALWVTEPGAKPHARQIPVTGGNRNGLTGVKWLSDGRLVFTSRDRGQSQILIAKADGSEVKRLTEGGPLDAQPDITADGRYLIFLSLRSGRLNLWRADLAEDRLKQLTSGQQEQRFDLSPDGRWIVFESLVAGVLKLHKISIDGGAPIPLTDQPSAYPSISPGGKLIACISLDPRSRQQKLLLLPIEGGAPLKTLEASMVGRYRDAVNLLRWTPDGQSLIYIDRREEGANLWRLPLDGSPPQQMTFFNDAKPQPIWSFDLSPDGKKYVIARGAKTSDVVMIK